MKKIAILGGGMASLVTAFELTKLPNWKNDYEITIYQQGWRLGGKGASGRNADKDRGDRIEEHGLHVLFGFYENAFRILQECYAKLHQEDPKHWPWRLKDALLGRDFIVMFEDVKGKMKPWDLHMPSKGGEPGIGAPVDVGLESILAVLLDNAIANASKLPGVNDGQPLPPFDPGDPGSAPSAAPTADGDDVAPIAYLKEAQDIVRYLQTSRRAPGAREVQDIERLLPRIQEDITQFIAWQVQQSVADWFRRAAILANFSTVVAKGLLADEVLYPALNWFVIDSYDVRTWLERHDALQITVQSAPVQGMYDAAFNRGWRFGAGSCLQGILRGLLYKGDMLYKMKAGMGDTVFAPLYQVLEDRGVHFEFFHRVDDIQLSPDRKSIQLINVERQVRLKKPSYDPLRHVPIRITDDKEGTLPCWPNRPDKGQMIDSDAQGIDGHNLEDWWDPWRGPEMRPLQRGSDFDIVVLGISVGCLPDICRDLMMDPGNPEFRTMVYTLQTTQTQAMQLWMVHDLLTLKWKKPSPVVIPYVEPFDTWADMSQLIARENLPSPPVASIAYLCSPLPDDEPIPPRTDHDYPKRQEERVRQNALKWIDESATTLWPGFSWKSLYDPNNGQGPARFAWQHYCATVHPSDRYVLAVPGSNAQRKRADESGYENLYLTGDWIRTALSVGCLEAATMAGIQTARAIDSRVPKALHDWLPDPPKKIAPPPSKPPYIIRECEMLTLPPVEIDVQLRTFVVPANYDQLRRVCDTELNLGQPRRYQPAGPFVVFYCSDMDNVVPAGSVLERDFGVWIPVFASEAGGNPLEFLTYTPYLWVDNSPALVGGRTVFGFPKHIGCLTMPTTPGQPAVFGNDTWVNVLPGRRAEKLRLHTVQRTDGGVWEKPTLVWDNAQILAALKLIVGSLSNLPADKIDLLKLLFRPKGGMPMVFLKEFPHPYTKWEACYQAVLEGPVDLVGSPDGGLLKGKYEVEILECFTHRIRQHLGLEITGPPRRRNGLVYYAFETRVNAWMTFKAVVKDARIIWETTR